MARILALDTTADFGSLALIDGGRVVEEVPLYSTDGFAHVLWRHLDPLLQRHDWRLGDIDCFAAASGPGSFTGVRIGLTAMKGLADVEGKRVAAVSNLRAIAFYGSAPLRAVLLDARRGEVYGAVYDAGGRLQGEETVSPLAVFLAEWGVVTEFVTPTPEVFRAAVGERTVTAAPRAIAGAVGLIAEGMEWLDPVAADANYVRRSDAELFWKD
ncbi:MAG: tRNA (adenosine(37)-N6)-threonylcarbamoyltransferase complex dimerization subunit type 1 TsaB [Bryobacterales bacterium]|nr:tRNA (adenosine(37)-N6)-threonylcarbamoyltransferase complex dimerization subunit type 1 TsaB [Bryobacterales bacterium]